MFIGYVEDLCIFMLQAHNKLTFVKFGLLDVETIPCIRVVCGSHFFVISL